MRKKRIWFLFGAIALMALSSWMLLGEPTPQGVSPEAKKYLGNRTVSVLAGADRVEVFRVSPRRNQNAVKQIGGFPIVSSGTTQDNVFAQRLSSVILRQDYKKEFGLACNTITTVVFRIWDDQKPELGLRLWQGSDYVDILLCYKCGEYSVVGKSIHGPIVLSRVTPFKPFAMRSEFVRLAKQAFPKDKDIQALSEEND